MLNNVFKTYKDYQDKSKTPSETIKYFFDRISESKLDIFKSLQRIDSNRIGIPVYISSYGDSSVGIVPVKEQWGKGETELDAQASALMEMAERFSYWTFKAKTDIMPLQTYNHINDNTNFDLLNLEEITKTVYNNDPNTLDVEMHLFSNTPLRWVWSYDFKNSTRCLIPWEWYFILCRMNGAAAGNSIEEAICQSICELIERHVCSIVDMKRIKVPIIDINSIPDGSSKRLIMKYADKNVPVYILDFSLDLGISTLSVILYDPYAIDQNMGEILWMAGTGTDPEKALARALTEANQSGVDLMYDLSAGGYPTCGLRKLSSMREVEYFTNTNNIKSFSRLPNLSNDNIRIEVETLIRLLNKKNFNTYVVDLTHPLLRIPSVLSIIPGIHFSDVCWNHSVGSILVSIICEYYKSPHDKLYRLKEISKSLPNKTYLNYAIANCFLEMHMIREAIAYYKQTIKFCSDGYSAHYAYFQAGLAYINIGEFQNSIDMLNKSIETIDKTIDIYKKERYIKIYKSLSLCEFQLGNYKKGFDYHTEADRLQRLPHVEK